MYLAASNSKTANRHIYTVPPNYTYPSHIVIGMWNWVQVRARMSAFVCVCVCHTCIFVCFDYGNFNMNFYFQLQKRRKLLDSYQRKTARTRGKITYIPRKSNFHRTTYLCSIFLLMQNPFSLSLRSSVCARLRKVLSLDPNSFNNGNNNIIIATAISNHH